MQEEAKNEDGQEMSLEDLMKAGKLPLQHEAYPGSMSTKQIDLEGIDPLRLAALKVSFWNHNTGKIESAQMGSLFTEEGESVEEARTDAQEAVAFDEADATIQGDIASKHAVSEAATDYISFEYKIAEVPSHDVEVKRIACEFDKERDFFVPEKSNTAWETRDEFTQILLNGVEMNREVISFQRTEISGTEYAYGFNLDGVQIQPGDKVEIRCKRAAYLGWLPDFQAAKNDLGVNQDEIIVKYDAYETANEAAQKEAKSLGDEEQGKVEDAQTLIAEGTAALAEGNKAINDATLIPEVNAGLKTAKSGIQNITRGKVSKPGAQANVDGYAELVAIQKQELKDAESTKRDGLAEIEKSLAYVNSVIAGYEAMFPDAAKS